MRKILVLEPFGKEHTDRMLAAADTTFELVQLPKNYGEETLLSALREAEIVVGQPAMKYIQKPGENCPQLRLIQMTWAGTDQYTRSSIPFPKEQISLANASGAYGRIISQFVMAQILSLMLNFKTYHVQQQKKIWERRGPIQSLDKAKVLIFGAGDIGTMIARRLQGFDARIIGVCRDTSKKRPFFDELCSLEEAEKYIPEADVVIGCIPNTELTRDYMNAERLRKMKQGAILVNVGRGNFVDCRALDGELRNGHLWGAALDVTNPEPLPEEHPLWENPRCIITPHASGVAFDHLKETEELLCEIACENIGRYCRGEELRNRIF